MTHVCPDDDEQRDLSEDSMNLLHPERGTIATAELTVGNHHRGLTQMPTTHSMGRRLTQRTIAES